MNELLMPFIIATAVVTLAAILWKVVFGISFISGYGVGQKGGNNLKTLFTEDKKKVPIHQRDNIVPTPQREVIIVSGSLHSEHWTQDSWIQWLEMVHEKKDITPKVVTGPHNDKESKDRIKELLEKGAIELKKLENKETKHFFIIDKDWAHIEEKHTGPEIPGGIRVKHLYPGSRKELCGKFEMLWNKAKPVTLDNIENIFNSDKEYSKA
jgi:hypothetical protein